ncbi:MAG: tetraacyldisaccharide 4'-kinase [Oligoflexia bacterium]|nr:tetraacyldisaccharide 4'-kinase [Oligoflexia bacterium]
MRILLLPFSIIFGFFVYLRNFFYKIGLLKSHKLPVFVVSIGNLTMGGTGKTPITEAVIEIYKNLGIKATVLTRGYGRRSKKIEAVELTSAVEDVGDEPLWIKTKQPSAEVIVGANRLEAFKKVGSSVQVVILDDGFQHQKIKRDKNIVLVDATASMKDYMLFPLGLAREQLSSLSRCDAIFLTKSNLADIKKLDLLKEKIKNVKKIFEVPFLFDKCVDIKNQQLELDLKGKSVLLVSGIANPTSFKKIVENQGANTVGHIEYRDHYFYTQKDVENIEQRAVQKNAEYILTTEKDATKLIKLHLTKVVGVVKLKVQISHEVENWLKF